MVSRFQTVLLFCLLMPALLVAAPGASWGDIGEATAILEKWTSFHWGRDCLVWIVHYPEELVEPWIAAEAARGGMSEGEREDYRKAFVADLRINDTEPFLVTIYAFGPRPLDFGGFAEAVGLVTAGGEKVKPLSYERKFDQPVSGIVQGLVFFPKQPDKNFSVVMKRLGVVEEQLFSFAREETVLAALPEERPKEVVVVELPPAPPKTPPKPKVQEAPPPPPPPPPIPAAREELAELKPQPEPDLPPPPPPAKDQVVFISRDKTLELFIRRWIDGDTAGMYDLLSSDTRTLLNEEQFGRQVGATGLRLSLRDGYKVQWQEGDRAKVVTAQKMLLFRTLRSKMLSLVKEGKIWKVTW